MNVFHSISDASVHKQNEQELSGKYQNSFISEIYWISQIHEIKEKS